MTEYRVHNPKRKLTEEFCPTKFLLTYEIFFGVTRYNMAHSYVAVLFCVVVAKRWKMFNSPKMNQLCYKGAKTVLSRRIPFFLGILQISAASVTSSVCC